MPRHNKGHPTCCLRRCRFRRPTPRPVDRQHRERSLLPNADLHTRAEQRYPSAQHLVSLTLDLDPPQQHLSAVRVQLLHESSRRRDWLALPSFGQHNFDGNWRDRSMIVKFSQSLPCQHPDTSHRIEPILIRVKHKITTPGKCMLSIIRNRLTAN